MNAEIVLSFRKGQRSLEPASLGARALFLHSIQELEKSKKKYLMEVSSLVEKLKEKESTYQTLQDEYQALHTASDATEAKLSTLEKENDQLVSGVMWDHVTSWLCMCVCTCAEDSIDAH